LADGLKEVAMADRQQPAAHNAASLVIAALTLGGFAWPSEAASPSGLVVGAGQVTKPSWVPSALPTPVAPQQVVIKLDPGTLGTREPPRIPRELPPAAYRFFGRKTELKQLIDRLRAGLNTAVVGPAGLGKTALAARALADVVGVNAANLASSPFPDGLVYLDLYPFHGQAEPAWNTLANRLCGPEFTDRWPPRDRAAEACRAKRILVIIEGGEEANGSAGRATIPELLGVLSPECRWLLLTRVSTQAAVVETVDLKETLLQEDATALLDLLTERRPLDPHVRQTVLELLEGHPLALTWAGNLLARDDEDPAGLTGEWTAGGLPRLSDPRQAERTLRWLFNRSVRGVDDTARQALAAAGLLDRAPFPLGSMVAAIGGMEAGHADGKRAFEALKSLVQRGLLRRAERDHWQFTHVLGYRFARDEGGSDPALLQRLGHWLHGALIVELKTHGSGEGPTAVGNLLQHAAALLRADDEQRLWEPLVSGLFYGIADRLEDMGRLDLVTSALGAVADWLAQLPNYMAEQPFWRRQHCVLIVDQGDVLRAQGDLAGALTAYRESLAVRRRLAEADPSNAGWQRDLSFSLTRLAEFHEQQGERAVGLPFAKESLSIDERLSALDPTNITWQKDVAVSRGLVARLRGE
jgi:tetratricopeptide (TPR) repeat protein